MVGALLRYSNRPDATITSLPPHEGSTREGRCDGRAVYLNESSRMLEGISEFLRVLGQSAGLVVELL